MKKVSVILFFVLCSISIVSSAECGDVNSSGTVDIVDALLVAKSYVGASASDIDVSIGDVNNDGSVFIVDALLIAQYYVDVITKFDCKKPEIKTPPPTAGGGGSYDLIGWATYGSGTTGGGNTEPVEVSSAGTLISALGGNGADLVTTSYCKFYYTDKGHGHRLSLLSGNSSDKCKQDGNKQHHTIHHNWFTELVKSRAPRLYFGKAHIFNNFYNSPGNNYCIGIGTWASAHIENNYFKDIKDPHRRQND